MRILKDTVRPELARIKRELEALKELSVHIGIMGDSENDLLTIARVHEYGATISAKTVKNLAIPLTQEAKDAGSPRKFNDLRYIPGEQPGVGFLVRDPEHAQKPSEPHEPIEPKQRKAKPQRTSGTKDPRPSDDFEWLYMLVKSVNIPERSFIRNSYDTGRSTLEDICKDAVDGIVRQQWTASEAMDFIGKWALEMTRGHFNTKLTPPKSATTQLTSTQYQPLYDTGRLFRSIVYRVEGGGGT